jgi:cell division protein FtsQ
MASTIRRGPAPRRPALKRKTSQPRRSIIDRLLAMLPVSEETLRRIATWTIFGAVLAGLLALATWMGIPAAAGAALAEGIGRAGFRVDEIEVTGAKHMDPMTVYAVALDQKSRAMPLVDLEGVREKLLSYGWIADAHVSRRLPNKLLIDIVERTPSAVWQNKGQLTLIADNGVELEPVSAEAMPDLPLVIGEGADSEEPAYQKLLSAAPALKPQIKAATWVGNRRWDLLFVSGETLALPAGDDAAAAALLKFAEIDGSTPLLGKGYVRFDMRIPKQLVVRKPDGVENRAITDPATTGDATTTAHPAVTEARSAALGDRQV